MIVGMDVADVARRIKIETSEKVVSDGHGQTGSAPWIA